jgi:hypothetical protein
VASLASSPRLVVRGSAAAGQALPGTTRSRWLSRRPPLQADLNGAWPATGQATGASRRSTFLRVTGLLATLSACGLYARRKLGVRRARIDLAESHIRSELDDLDPSRGRRCLPTSPGQDCTARPRRGLSSRLAVEPASDLLSQSRGRSCDRPDPTSWSAPGRVVQLLAELGMTA